jgi:predicted DNA-binding ribbon-helix-helix protein
MAENAPEELKQFAQERGIDLEEMLTTIASKAEERKKVLDELKSIAEESGVDVKGLFAEMAKKRSEMEEKFSGMANFAGPEPASFEKDPLMIFRSALFGGEDAESDSSSGFAVS